MVFHRAAVVTESAKMQSAPIIRVSTPAEARRRPRSARSARATRVVTSATLTVSLSKRVFTGDRSASRLSSCHRHRSPHYPLAPATPQIAFSARPAPPLVLSERLANVDHGVRTPRGYHIVVFQALLNIVHARTFLITVPHYHSARRLGEDALYLTRVIDITYPTVGVAEHESGEDESGWKSRLSQE